MVDVVQPQVAASGAAPEGHNEAMLAKVDEVEKYLQEQQQAQEKQEKPKLAGKFESPEDLEKAYLELQKKLGGQEKPAQKANASEEMTEEKADELITAAGLDLDEFSDYFAENGELSEDHYEALEKAGIPREYVDNYIDGVRAAAEQHRDNIMEKVGGQETFQAMSQWAVANLSRAELAAYNKAVESGDMTVVENAVLGLAYRYQQEVGRDPKLVGGANAVGSGFQSVAQLVEAMKDPRYEKDPAYRREIEQRLARSNIM